MIRESKLWSLHLLAGLCIVFLIGVHFGVMHLDEIFGFADVLSYQSVLSRGKTGFYLVVYSLLLGSAIYHGLYGLRNIIFELGFGRSLEKAVSIILLFGGIVSFIYGEYAIIVAFTL